MIKMKASFIWTCCLRSLHKVIMKNVFATVAHPC